MNINSLPTMCGSTQLIIGVVLAIVIVACMRRHSVGYTAAVMLAAGASLFIHSFPLMGAAIALSCVIAVVTLCSRSPQHSHR